MGQSHITQIPVPGNSGDKPTGAMQFEQDWPGLFIRGDSAAFLLRDIRHVERLLKEQCHQPLPSLLAEIADIIEQDVIVANTNVPEPT